MLHICFILSHRNEVEAHVADAQLTHFHPDEKNSQFASASHFSSMAAVMKNDNHQQILDLDTRLPNVYWLADVGSRPWISQFGTRRLFAFNRIREFQSVQQMD